MDTKTIMTVLALLGSGTLLNGCDDAATSRRATPKTEPTSSTPAKPEAVRAPPESQPARPPASPEPEAVRAQPESKPATAVTPTTDKAERARPERKPARPPPPAKVEATEVTPAAPANRAGQEAADTKGEMKCGEGKCGAAPNTEP
jgi:hypothetical protein